MRKIVIALPKTARLLGKAYEIFKRAGYNCPALEDEIKNNVRKQLEFCTDEVVYLLVTNDDIPQYVDRNWADLGITAFDCYREYELSSMSTGGPMRGDNFISDLLPDMGLCQGARFCIAGLPQARAFYERCKTNDEKILTAATTYPGIAANFFRRKGILADIVSIRGSSELMPLHSSAEVIFDIVETGRALKENGLEIFEEAMPLVSKILVSKAAYKYDENIVKMIEVLKNAIK